MKRLRLSLVILLLLCVSASLRLSTPAQIRPVYDQGALGLAQLLKRLNTTASALMIGAHPDDEDTALLAYLARGENARTAYLSLTRGDGGQNIIGPELGEALGVIRTEELLQARKLDGAEQFFTRAYDYGFSKTLAEAKSKWDEKIILCDVVHVIRKFQPMVVISQFSGTPIDGHGQHQYAGYISPIAVKAAADPRQCEDSGEPWQVRKFYVRHRGTDEPTLKINTGKYDPLLGRSYFEIAMHARSQHRSQEQGVLELKGDQFSQLTLMDGPTPMPKFEKGIFDGIDVSVAGGSTAGELSAMDPAAAISQLLRHLPNSAEPLLAAAGIRIDVLADSETAIAGDRVPVAVRLFAPEGRSVRIAHVSFNLPSSKLEDVIVTSQSSFRREQATASEYHLMTIPDAPSPTRPFWLAAPREGDLYYIPRTEWPGRPFLPAAAVADITINAFEQDILIRRPVEYRYADDIRGEIRRDLNIVPKLAVALESELIIVSTRERTPSRRVSVNVTNNNRGAVKGSVKLEVPDGWKVTPAAAEFSMSRKDEKTTVNFVATLPAEIPPGVYEIKGLAQVDGETFSRTIQTIAYDHIRTHRIYRVAKASVKLIDLRTVPVKVGYIRGSGDRVADAIKQLGLDAVEIDGATLAGGDLSKFDTIVVGIRAFQVRPDIVANNQRLLDFAKNGGTLIVQYQLPPTYAQQNLTPYPAQMGPRVVDENAAVTILQPTHPLFNFPNKITQEDFKGWVQERNLYNFSTMDKKYEGLLETHDAGEAENRGGLVVADIAKGKYVYCSYSLFRQLPAGVPGAYRLLSNMLAYRTTSGR